MPAKEACFRSRVTCTEARLKGMKQASAEYMDPKQFGEVSAVSGI